MMIFQITSSQQIIKEICEIRFWNDCFFLKLKFLLLPSSNNLNS